MGSSLDAGIGCACDVWTPLRPAQPLETTPPQRAGNHVGDRCACLPYNSSVSLFKLRRRNYRSLGSVSLLTYCLRAGPFHHALLANQATQPESHRTHHLFDSGNAPGRRAFRIRPGILKLAWPLRGCCRWALDRTYRYSSGSVVSLVGVLLAIPLVFI